MLSDYFDKNVGEIFKCGHSTGGVEDKLIDNSKEMRRSVLVLDLTGFIIKPKEEVDQSKYMEYSPGIYLSTLLYILCTSKEKLLEHFDGNEYLLDSIISRFKKNILDFVENSSGINPSIMKGLNDLYYSL